MLLVHRLKQVGVTSNGFRRTQEKKSIGFQCVMEGGKGPLLYSRVKINKEIPATYKIHARERRVADEILSGEDDHFAKHFFDPVAPLLLDKESTKSFGRNILSQILGVETVAALI